jgi:predicted RNase H-like HicB family nuclease
MKEYRIKVFWSDEDNSWVADVTNLRSCSAFGPTPQAALTELAIALELHIEVLDEQKKQEAASPRGR